MGERYYGRHEIRSIWSETSPPPPPTESGYVQVPSIAFQIMLHDLTSMRERLSRLETAYDSLSRQIRVRVEELPFDTSNHGMALREMSSTYSFGENCRSASAVDTPSSLDTTLSSYSRPFVGGLPGSDSESRVSQTVVGVPTTTHSGRVMESSFWAFQYNCLEDGEVSGSLGSLRIRRGVAGKTHLLEWATKNGASYYPEFKDSGLQGEATAFACIGYVTVRGSAHITSRVRYGRNKKDAERLVVFDLLHRMFGVPLEKLHSDCF